MTSTDSLAMAKMLDHRREDAGVAADQPLGQGGHGRHQEKAEPEAVEHQ
jgi:hypothetical protein